MKKILKCRFCKSEKNLTKDCKTRSKNKVHQYYSCRSCNTLRAKQYRQTESGKLSIRKAVAKYESNNPQRRLAWSAVQRVPKQPCTECGSTDNIHRHHPNPNKKYEIVFLCPLHHKAVHNRNKHL